MPSQPSHLDDPWVTNCIFKDPLPSMWSFHPLTLLSLSLHSYLPHPNVINVIKVTISMLKNFGYICFIAFFFFDTKSEIPRKSEVPSSVRLKDKQSILRHIASVAQQRQKFFIMPLRIGRIRKNNMYFCCNWLRRSL